ncbi:hypothetical protein LTR36_007171 [Oleoguttula mirabilis]|uniref:DUF1168-domain-containing protein n=1 Tax=Oleoguttula mirabilis TaxID=1507867 RepID=A0AAV9JAL8_9PEZI|nr:hypothetical protein LTR36_007171 [Oleoguttula mirabilis]
MSEPIPESIPTSADRRSNRPTKKRALNTPTSQQSHQVDALFAHPDREITLPNGTLTKHRGTAPPEIVANVQGSSAGAGSGEFHVYKASRRRENERLRVMDEEVATEKADAEFEAKQEELRRGDEEKLGKNRAKREKARMRKLKGKGGGEVDGGGQDGVKKKLGAAKVGVPSRGGGGAEAEGLDDGVEQAGDEGGGITIHDDD